MSKITELAARQITITEMITIELVEANGKIAAVIVRWSERSSVLDPGQFPTWQASSSGCLPRLPPN